MSAWTRRLIILLLGVAAWPGGMLPVTDQPASPAELARTVFDARGTNDTLLHVHQAGRYSLRAQSGQGTRLEILDRMAGPFAADGVMGETDGRLDLLLDQGTYKLRLHSHTKGSGEVTATVAPFREMNEAAALRDLPFLPSRQVVESALGDLEQRSWWIHIEQRQTFRLEVMGRNLRDCRLWQDGSWLADVRPTAGDFEPVAGQPMQYLEFHHDLNPGLYLLTCYGGPPADWTQNTGEHPLYLRQGVPYLGENGQRLFTMSPFGRDAFLVGGDTNYFQLVRPDKKATSLQVRYWSENDSRFGYGESADITKESRDPWCSLYTNYGSPRHWVIVTAAPGDTLELDYFVQQDRHQLPDKPNQFWISSIHSAAGRDAIDATALLIAADSKTPLEASTLNVGAGQPLARRVNLLNSASVYLFVETTGTYAIAENPAAGASAEYQAAPFMVSRPRGYRPPPFVPAGSELELTRGYYVLAMNPRSTGILHFDLRLKNEAGVMDWESPAATTGPQRQSILWPQVTLDRSANYYTVWLNQRPGVESGLLVRPLPIDLTEPLPATLRPGEQVTFPATVAENSLLDVTGGSFELRLNETAHNLKNLVTPGRYQVTLRNTGTGTALFNVRANAVSLMPPPPPQPQDWAALLTILTEADPLYVDFARGEAKFYILRVTEAGLYRLETSGRLATRIRVRTRLTTSLFGATENGVGRNALVQQYFRPGEYLVSVQVRGNSAGRAGIHLRRTPLAEVSGLAPGGIVRRSVPADDAIRLPFTLTDAGTYHLDALGLGKTFARRLEDADGWPLLPTDEAGPITMELEPGTYHYFSLPEPVDSRRVVTLRRVTEAEKIRGKGPHPLTLNQPLDNIWLEESGRPPDVYTLAMTADAKVHVWLKPTLTATIHGPDGAGAMTVRDGFAEGVLAAGDYRIEVRSVEENNRVPYTLRITTDALLPGVPRVVTELPHTLPVSVSRETLQDIASFGRTDVKAYLWDENLTELLAWNDDRPDDWNFLISRRLPAGRYQLKLVAVGADIQPFTVTMDERPEKALPRQKAPFSMRENLADTVLKIPFTTRQAGLIRFTGSAGRTGLALYRQGRLLAEGEEQLIVPLAADAEYTLLAWQSAGDTADIAAAPLDFRTINLTGDSRMEPALTAARLRDTTGLSWRCLADSAALLYAPALERPCLPLQGEPVALAADGGWLVATAAADVRLEPFVIGREKPVTVLLGDMPLHASLEQDLDAPLLLRAETVDRPVGISAYPAGQAPPEEYRWAGMLAQPTDTFFGIPGKGSYQARMWSTGDRPVIRSARMRETGSERVTLHLTSFPPLGQRDFRQTPSLEQEIPPGRSLLLTLPDGPQPLRLTMGRGIMAYAWQADDPQGLVACLEENGERSLTPTGGLLTILNTATAPALFRAEKIPASLQTSVRITPGGGHETVAARAGTLRFDVAALPAGQRLYVAGEELSARLWSADGRLRAPRVVRERPWIAAFDAAPGILEIHHETGLISVWMDAADRPARRLAAGSAEAAPVPLAPGLLTLQDGPQAWTVTLSAPELLTVATDAPGVISLHDGETVLDLRAASTVTDRHLVRRLPAGTYRLGARPLAGQSRTGVLRCTRLEPEILPPGEEAPHRLVRPGEIQAFTFRVTTRGLVGAGIRTDTDRLTAWLTDMNNVELARGPLMFRELPPGDYLLLVAGGDAPVQYRPVVLGTTGSRQGIPDDVLDNYLKEERQ